MTAHRKALADALDRAGAVTQLGSSRFTLDEPGWAWYVSEGGVDVFASRDPTTERWRPVATADRGALVTSFPRGEAGYALLARPLPGSAVERVAVAEIATWRHEGAALAAALDAWLRELLGALCGGLSPKEFKGFDPGDELELGRGAVARLIEGVAWIDVESGSAELPARIGEPELPDRCPGVVCSADWILAHEDAVLRARSTSSLLEAGELWNALEEVAVDAVGLIERQVAASEEQEQAILSTRPVRERELAAITERSLAAVLEPGAPPIGVGPAGDLLFGAATIVAQAQGVELRRPPLGSSDREAPLTAIARASRAHVRPVSLDGNWWREDVGPLIAYRGEDRSPVALLRRWRGYTVHDPATGNREPMTEALAAELEPQGHLLYASLPPGPVSLGSFMGFAARGSRRDARRLLIAGVALMALGMLTPILTGQILGTFLPRGELDVITALCLVLLAAAVVTGMLAALQNFAALRIEGRVLAAGQAGVWARVMALAPRELRDESTGNQATTVLAPIMARSIVSTIAVRTITSALVGVGGLILIFIYDLRLGALTIALLTVLGVATALTARKVARRERAILKSTRTLNSRAFQLIGHVDKLRTAGAEERGFAHWARGFGLTRAQTYAARVTQNRLTAFNASFTILAMALAFYLIANVIDVPLSTFLAFNVAFGQAIAGALLVSATAVTLAALVPLWESLQELLGRSVEDTAERPDPGELAGEVEANQVSFRYAEDGPLVLDGVSLRAEPGEFVAVVGPSGSGKSTLLRLLLGFEQPTAGTILYDGQDLGDVDVAAVRRQCGVVLQDDRLLIGDLRTNIGGAGLYTEQEVWEAGKMVGLADDVRAMPMQMATYVGEGTGALSGGQRQRVILARAMITRPRVLFLDEATSALDNRTQDLVTESMRRLSATRVVIAHRLSTIRDADRILVIDGGRVVESGTYDELMSRDGLFRELAERQLA